MLKYYAVSFKHDLFPLLSYNSGLRFAFDWWKCIQELDPDTITHLIKDILKEYLFDIHEDN